MSERHRIIGIDPGTRITGYGIIEVTGNGILLIDFGCIRPPPSLPLHERFRIIHEGVAELMLRHEPHSLSVETQYFPRESPNVNSLIKLGMARGVIVLAAAQRHMSVHEYAPARVKQAVVGNGRASKEQIQSMIQRLLALESLPQPADAADALALAICHAHSLRHNKLFGEMKCTHSSAEPFSSRILPTPSLKPKASVSNSTSPSAPTLSSQA